MTAPSLTLFMCLLFALAQGQIPKPGAILNYTQVMFEYPALKGADVYVLQLTETATDPNFDHCLVERKDSANATMIEGLEFGKKYQWRYAGIAKGQRTTWNGPFRFEIESNKVFDQNLVNLVVTKNDSAHHQGGLILNDCTHNITDRNGKMVWYLQKVDWHGTLAQKTIEMKPQIFDLRLTAYGNITYLADSVAIESDLEGNHLWKAPNDSKVSGLKGESYNHDFKRLPNGHYMVLGNELWRKLPEYHDTALIKKKYPNRQVVNGEEYGGVEFGTVIEYDKKGRLIWSWNSQDYFDPNPLKPWPLDVQSGWEEFAHINAFSTDSKNEAVYVGFRNISRIVKVDKKTNKVVDSWGQHLANSETRNLVAIRRQHDANMINDSTLAIFNSNDLPGYDSFSRVLLISTKPSDNGRVVWSFDCNLDSLDHHASRNGGNVDLLPNGNLLVCMGNMNRIFEVTKQKKIVWQEAIQTTGKSGDMFFHRLYRSHYISSLYPCYFAFKVIEDTVSERSPRFHVKIFNKGSEADSYIAQVTTATGNIIAEFKAGPVEANRSKQIELTSGRSLHAGDKIEVEVISKTNPDFKRKAQVIISK